MLTPEELAGIKRPNLNKYVEDYRNDEPFGTANPLWRDYAMGQFREVSSDVENQFTTFIGEHIVRVSDNVIGQSLTELSSRIRFDKYDCEDDQKVAGKLGEFALKNNLTKAIVSVTKRALTDGNAAMSVSWQDGPEGSDSGRPVIHHENWWDGAEGVFIAVSDSGEVEWAVSEWKEGSTTRRTIYLPDRILRQRMTGRGWTLIEEVPWVRSDDRPLGVPMAHFPNGSPAYGQYGTSTVGQVIEVQDSLNATLFNRQAVVALTGMQIYWASGVEQNAKLPVKPGIMWSSASKDAKFGALTSGSLESLHTECEDLRTIICGEFPIPSYRLGGGTWPAGIALQRADSPMIARCKMIENVFNAGVVLIGHRSVEMMNHFGGEALNEDAPITVSWRPTDEVDPGTQIEIDLDKARFYGEIEPLSEVLLRKSGFLTEKELKELVKEREEARDTMLAQTASGGTTEFGS